MTIKSLLHPLALFLLFFLCLTTSASGSNARGSYFLCPLGESAAYVELEPSTGHWVLSGTPTNVTAKPCWCITYETQFPAFCPPQFDTCRIDSHSYTVTCLSLTSMRASRDWVVPFLGPFCVLSYLGLVASCCLTRRGLAARHYCLVSFLSLFCCCCRRRNKEYWREWSLNAFRRKYPRWVRSGLLQRGVAREREELRHAGIPDAMLAPTHLALSTKIYHADATTTENDDENDVKDDDVKENDDETSATEKQGAAVDECGTISSKGDEEETDGTTIITDEESGEIIIPIETTSTSNQQQPTVKVDDDMDSLFDSDQDVCAICMGDVEEGDRIGDIPCGHLFHVDCLKQWLKKKNECPMCSTQDIAQRRC